MKAVQSKRRYFSLLELFIVLMIVGLMAGGISLSFPQLINKERYEGSIDAVVSKFESAQDILFTYQCDVVLYLKITPEGLICILQPSSPIPPRILNAINHAKALAEIKRLSFDGKEYQELCLHYYTAGFQCPRGVLSLTSAKGEQKFLVLKGFPTKIESFKESPTLPALNASFPAEISSEGGV